MEQYQNSVQDTKGNALPALIQVAFLDTNNLAPIFSDNGITPKGNPFPADDTGEYRFYAANGRYTITISYQDKFDRVYDALLYDPVDSPLTAQSLKDDLANSADLAKGDALVAVKRQLLGAFSTTQHEMNEGSSVDPVRDFHVPNDGVTNATPAIQAMITAIAAKGVSEVVFPPGTYLLLNPAGQGGFFGDSAWCAAVIWKGLKNVRIRGCKGTKFTQGPGGAGAPQYAMFRLEECENVKFCDFEADGGGIDIHTTGAARSQFMFVCNYNLNTLADLAYPNRNIEIHHLKLDNFGGGIGSANRTEATLPEALHTENISIHDIKGTNFTGQNHFVGFTCANNVHVYNNRVINPQVAGPQVGNLFADMSAGVINALVENNWATRFTGGAKAETHTGVGVGSNEVRHSQNVVFFNNTFEQMGDPSVMVYPGPGGGGFYGIKLNGLNHAAINNTITARSTDIAGGGLYNGIQLATVPNANAESLHVVMGNSIRGPVVGINHDSPVDTTHLYTAHILNNKIYDTITPAPAVSGNDGSGIIVGRNVLVQNNYLYRTRRAAISVNQTDRTYIKDNEATDCSGTTSPIIAIRVVYEVAPATYAGYFEITGNRIFDGRGAAAAQYGYIINNGANLANAYVFTPGYTQGLTDGIAWELYFSAIGVSTQKGGVKAPMARTFLVTGNPQTTAPWNAAPWNVSDRALPFTPAVGVPKGWTCVTAGTPGVWVSEGNL